MVSRLCTTLKHVCPQFLVMITNLQRDKCGHLSLYCHICLNSWTRFHLIWKIPPLRHFKLSRWWASKLESNIVRTCYVHLPSFLCSPALALTSFLLKYRNTVRWKTRLQNNFGCGLKPAFLWWMTKLEMQSKDLFVCLFTFSKLTPSCRNIQ